MNCLCQYEKSLKQFDGNEREEYSMKYYYSRSFINQQKNIKDGEFVADLLNDITLLNPSNVKREAALWYECIKFIYWTGMQKEAGETEKKLITILE